jgi:hypothetical protein
VHHHGVVNYPTEWEFALDARTTHMSLTPTAPGRGPVLATPETVDDVVQSFVRVDGTPSDVNGLLELSHKLLRTSVIHYEFAALAVEKSLQALERALRLRFDVSDRVAFKDLISRAGRAGLVSAADQDVMDTARQLRNMFAHPATSPALPLVMVVGMLENSHRLIAGLFPSEAADA